MPQMSCMLNGELLIFCSSKDMKKVMYDNPSRPCNSSDLHYQIRSEKVQTDGVVFHIINVTFARDNGSTIYCNWKNDDGFGGNISMQIVVIGEELLLLLLLSLITINFLYQPSNRSLLENIRPRSMHIIHRKHSLLD